jgi:tRNA-intron endonuclease
MAGVLRDATVYVDVPGEASTLLNKGFFGEPRSGGGLSLTLLEATYLAESGRLAVTTEDGAVPIREMLRRGQMAGAGFEIRYLVYRDLRQRGYIVREAPAPLNFRVYPRGGAPKRTPSKYGVVAFSERSVFDLGGVEADVRRAAGARKSLLLAVVDEESDITYYAVREVAPKGRALPAAGEAQAAAHLLEDRATVLDETQAARLYAHGFYGKMVGARLQISLLETAFLLKSGAIELRRADSNRPVSLAALRTQARRLQPDFDLRLRVYEDLKARAIVAKTGFKYGSHFRAYEGDPDRVHARYLIHALPRGHRGMWPEVSRAVRLAHGVKKDLLFASVGDDVTYLRLERVRP